MRALRAEFDHDVGIMGRWLLYGSQDKTMATRHRELLGEEIEALDEDDESFGLGYPVALSIKLGRETGALTSTGAAFADRPDPVGPVSIVGARFFLPVSDEGWKPQSGDLIFSVEWTVPFDQVPQFGRVSDVYDVYQVATTQPMFENQGKLAYWMVYARELNYTRDKLVTVLGRRWPDADALAWAGRYRRS